VWSWGAWAAAWYGAWSLIALIAYWRDKRAAQSRAWRTRERTLHIIEFLGGWPGAFIAQTTLRHKTRDTGFLAVYWLIVALHLIAWTIVLIS